jgi:hypothetical protein
MATTAQWRILTFSKERLASQVNTDKELIRWLKRARNLKDVPVVRRLTHGANKPSSTSWSGPMTPASLCSLIIHGTKTNGLA